MKKIILLTMIAVVLATSSVASSTEFYRVQLGDTLWAISQRHNVSVENLARWNNLTDLEKIYMGQILRLTPVVNQNQPGNWQVHRVQAGETLWLISLRFNVSVQELMQINNITDIIYPGQELKIRQILAPNWQIYRVKPGDTLWRISNQFGVTIESILAINHNTDPQNLSPGMELRIPSNRGSGIRIFQPAANDVVGSSFTVKGQANVFEGNVLYRLINDQGVLLLSKYTTAGQGDWYDFEISINVPQGIKKSSVFYLELYTKSAKDGSEEHLNTLPLLLK